jgi:two-component system, chemotaxis family, chemotaxis protein CheY
MAHTAGQIRKQLDALKVLVVDDEHTMRRVTRSLLQAIGVKNIRDACDGHEGLQAVCSWGPDVAIVDWKMPNLSGLEFVRRVRSPNEFPYPDLPIVMLTAFGERSRVLEAVDLGVNEFLLKPVSSKALQGRLVSILTRPRRMVQKGGHYIPEPRKVSSYLPDLDLELSELVLVN